MNIKASICTVYLKAVVIYRKHTFQSKAVFCCFGSVFASFIYRINALLVHVLNMVANLRKHQLIENAAKIHHI